MKQTLEDLIRGYLQGVDLEAISDNRFRCLVDLYRDLNKENHSAHEEQSDDLELEAFIKALQKDNI